MRPTSIVTLLFAAAAVTAVVIPRVAEVGPDPNLQDWKRVAAPAEDVSREIKRLVGAPEPDLQDWRRELEPASV